MEHRVADLPCVADKPSRVLIVSIFRPVTQRASPSDTLLGVHSLQGPEETMQWHDADLLQLYCKSRGL